MEDNDCNPPLHRLEDLKRTGDLRSHPVPARRRPALAHCGPALSASRSPHAAPAPGARGKPSARSRLPAPATSAPAGYSRRGERSAIGSQRTDSWSGEKQTQCQAGRAGGRQQHSQTGRQRPKH